MQNRGVGSVRSEPEFTCGWPFSPVAQTTCVHTLSPPGPVLILMGTSLDLDLGPLYISVSYFEKGD